MNGPLPPELLAKTYHGYSFGLILTVAALVCHTVAQIAGRAYTGLRSNGGLRGIFRAVYSGSATAAPTQPSGPLPPNVTPIPNAKS